MYDDSNDSDRLQADPTVRTVLITDKEYIVRSYRIILDVLEEVKVGFAPQKDLIAAIDNFVRFKLPEQYQVKLPVRTDLEAKYRAPFLGELAAIQQRYQSDVERKFYTAQIENDIKFNATLDLIESIKQLLESEKIMNNFVPVRGESLGRPT